MIVRRNSNKSSTRTYRSRCTRSTCERRTRYHGIYSGTPRPGSIFIWDSLRQWWYPPFFDNSLRTNTIYGICALLSSYCFIDYFRNCFCKDRRSKRYKSSPSYCLLGCSCHVPYKLCWIPFRGKCWLIFLVDISFFCDWI